MESNSNTKEKFSDLLNVYKSSLFFSFLLVFLLSSILLVYTNFNAELMASSQNIIGIFTSVVVHQNIAHLASNMALFFIALVLYSFSTMYLGQKRFWHITMIIWFSAAVANLIYVFFSPFSAIGGSSGLVCAFLGVVVISAFLGAWRECVQRLKIQQLIIGSFVLLAFVVVNMFVPPDTNVVVHIISFLVAFVLTIFVALKLHQ